MQRHCNPANGFRSNPIGIGGNGGGPGYRSYNRGVFGRGQPPPPRRIDVFMEAGKLAAEYLVSKGLIPPNSVNGKWQSSNLKNQIGGEGVSDAISGTSTSGRRRFHDDGIRARKTLGSFKNPGIEFNREKVKGSSSDKQGDGDSVSGSMEEQRSVKEGVTEERKSLSDDLDTITVYQENRSPDENVGVKTPISDVLNQDCVESEEKSDGKNVNTSTDVVMMESEKQIVKEELPEENNDNTANSNSSDLLTLIRFNKIPTRTRSSVSLKGSKSDPVLIAEDENKNKTQNSGELELGNSSSLHDDEEQKPKIEQVPSEENQKYKLGVCTRFESFPQRSSLSEQELTVGQDGYTRCSSDVLGRGEKRPLQFNEIMETSKKPCNSYGEEKQFFPNSFKMRDLNLMGGSDANENLTTNLMGGSDANENRNTSNSVFGFSSIGQTKQEHVSVDFDLTMNSSCDLPNRHIRRGSYGKGVEVIDLDCDSVQDDNNSERRDEAIFTDLGSFPDSMQRVSGMRQDGYGLMISELLEADIPNSSVPAGVNSMHNEMSLQNDEGILNDDESIYMSLGEIPISFVPVWDQQPSKRYDKRF